ncbi:tetratricopeptide repeat protein [Stutzerimonas stutzeri]|uniref:tetratricopeptide repeat protein n=1 Tax=Stutzerimonas stutzeri TaxID=316 RepID=UPI0015E3A1FA|nr:tetratricopeptide repeat protein [Stutzerimonas stutzeri]
MLESFVSAAERGHSDACYELARLLTDGKIVVKDVGAARLYLERSAELGNPEAVRVLAWNYLRGEYGEPSVQHGTMLMHQAAASSIRAQRELGMLYANIYQPNLNDLVLAEHFLRLAAEASDAEAAYQLGRMKHATADQLDAIAWFGAASAQGHTAAGEALTALSEGSEIDKALFPAEKQQPAAPLAEPESIDGEKLYRQASAILLQSQRTLKQEATAYAMLSLASEHGHEAARHELEFLKGVRTLMNRQNPAWLEEEKQRIASRPQP